MKNYNKIIEEARNIEISEPPFSTDELRSMIGNRNGSFLHHKTTFFFKNRRKIFMYTTLISILTIMSALTIDNVPEPTSAECLSIYKSKAFVVESSSIEFPLAQNDALKDSPRKITNKKVNHEKQVPANKTNQDLGLSSIASVQSVNTVKLTDEELKKIGIIKEDEVYVIENQNELDIISINSKETTIIESADIETKYDLPVYITSRHFMNKMLKKSCFTDTEFKPDLSSNDEYLNFSNEEIEKFNNYIENVFFNQDKYKSYSSNFLIPVEIKFGNPEDSVEYTGVIWEKINGKMIETTIYSNSDYILWYLPTSNFIEKLPLEISGKIKNELDIIIDLNDGLLDPTEVCENIGEDAFLDICGISIEEKYALKLYPIPASEELNIEFNIPVQNKISVAIHEVSGRLASSIVAGESYSKGLHTIKYNTGNLMQGAYLLVFRLEDGEQIIKNIIISK